MKSGQRILKIDIDINIITKTPYIRHDLRTACTEFCIFLYTLSSLFCRDSASFHTLF